ncbi:MAG TPA: Vi polysaccharide biosynthesis protein VipA/TviB, partial [Gammaproteobacteria bacterium]|nr:Vi polysaccharide biosynthesis protein VipA/TviB [Gammaproteobacteria bacterium]
RVIDIIKEFEQYHARVDVYDPWVNPEEAEEEYQINVIPHVDKHAYDAIVLAVGHKEFCDLGETGIRDLGRENHILFDVKGLLPRSAVDGRL